MISFQGVLLTVACVISISCSTHLDCSLTDEQCEKAAIPSPFCFHDSFLRATISCHTVCKYPRSTADNRACSFNCDEYNQLCTDTTATAQASQTPQITETPDFAKPKDTTSGRSTPTRAPECCEPDSEVLPVVLGILLAISVGINIAWCLFFWLRPGCDKKRRIASYNLGESNDDSL